MKHLHFPPLLLCFFTVFALIFSNTGFADSIVMTNGDVIKGRVSEISKGKLSIKPPYSDTILVDIHYLKALKTSGFLWVRLQGEAGFKLIRFSSREGKIMMGDRKGKVTQLKDKRSIARISLKKPETGWISAGSAALTFNSDDSGDEKQNYGTKGDIVIKNPLNTNTFSWKTFTESSNNETTSKKWDVIYGYQRYLNASIYLQGNASWNYAMNQTPQSLITTGGGIGYEFWNDSTGSLQSDLGLNHLWESYQDNTSQQEFALRWNLQYTRTLIDQLNCYQEINWLQPLDNGLILSTQTGCKFQVTDNFFINAEYDYNYTTKKNPSATVGSRRLSHILNFGLGVSW